MNSLILWSSVVRACMRWVIVGGCCGVLVMVVGRLSVSRLMASEGVE